MLNFMQYSQINGQCQLDSSAIKCGFERKNSQVSCEQSLQTKTTILIQESKKQEDQSIEKVTSLRTVKYEMLLESSRENTITVISTVRDDEQQGFSLSQQIKASNSSIKVNQPQKLNKKLMTNYRIISPSLDQYKNLNNQLNDIIESQANNCNSIFKSSPQIPLSFDSELNLIEQLQFYFQYKTFLSQPHLVYLTNLTRQEQIEHLLSKESFTQQNNNFSFKKNEFIKQSSQNIPNFQNYNEQTNQPQYLLQTSYQISGFKSKISSEQYTHLNKNLLNSNFPLKIQQSKDKLLNPLIKQFQSTTLSTSSPSKSLLTENCIKQEYSQDSEIVMSAINQFFNKHSVIKRETIFSWIYQQISNKQPHDNYIHKFIFHKKYKDFETEEQKYQGVSRFHNLNRMFMHNIIKILVKENLQKFEIPFSIMEKITQIISGIKNEAFKKYNNGKSKTCFFNHYHYNLLFLQINTDTLKLFQKSSKDLELHQSIIGISLDSDQLNQLDVTYCNLVKYYIFCVIDSTISQNIQSQDYNNCVRLQYVQRVLNGIKKLSAGQAIKRF